MDEGEYQIHREESFIETSWNLSQIYPSLVEFNKFLNWHLVRKPKKFTKEPKSHYSILSEELNDIDNILEIRRVADFPKVKVVYHVDDKEKIVTLKEMILLEP